MSKGWIGVDLDGTLAFYEGWQGADQIGAPIPAMVDRVKRWLADGQDVRIFTARITTGEDHIRQFIDDWVVTNIGVSLPITNVKDFGMIELWDDRAVQVARNTGEVVGYSTRGL